MTWLGLWHDSETWRHPDMPPASKPRGALVVQPARPSATPILTGPGLSLAYAPDGRITLTCAALRAPLTLTVAKAAQDAPLCRIVINWNQEAGWLRLAADHPAQARFEQVTAPLTGPLDPWDLTPNAPQTTLALSDRIEPLGPMPGLLGPMRIDSDAGPRQLATLRRGDLVRDAGGQLVPVLANLSRVFPARGLFRPYRLPAPTLGLTEDLLAAPFQKLVLGGSHVRYLFGCDKVAVSLNVLRQAGLARPETGGQFVRYHQLVLPDHGALRCAEGLEAQTLYLGRLAQSAVGRDQSLLRRMAGQTLPAHRDMGVRALRPDEVRAYVLARRAA